MSERRLCANGKARCEAWERPCWEPATKMVEVDGRTIIFCDDCYQRFIQSTDGDADFTGKVKC